MAFTCLVFFRLNGKTHNMYDKLSFLQNNARINRIDKHGQTAIFYSAEHGQTHVVKYLLSMDADVLIRFVTSK